MIKLEDGKTDAYIASPPADKAKKDCAILYIADIYGIWQNSKLMADSFAAAGYTTLIPDLFNGDQLPVDSPEGFDILGWIAKGTGDQNPHTKEYIDPVVVSGIKTLKAHGFKNIGSAGYCFGAKVSLAVR